MAEQLLQVQLPAAEPEIVRRDEDVESGRSRAVRRCDRFGARPNGCGEGGLRRFQPWTALEADDTRAEADVPARPDGVDDDPHAAIFRRVVHEVGVRLPGDGLLAVRKIDREHELEAGKRRIGVDDLGHELGARRGEQAGGVRVSSGEANRDLVVPMTGQEPATHLHEVGDLVVVLGIVHVARDLEGCDERDVDAVHDLDEAVAAEDEAPDAVAAELDVIPVEGRAPAGVGRMRGRSGRRREPDLGVRAHDAIDRHEDALDVVRRKCRPALEPDPLRIDVDAHDLAGKGARGRARAPTGGRDPGELVHAASSSSRRVFPSAFGADRDRT